MPKEGTEDKATKTQRQSTVTQALSSAAPHTRSNKQKAKGTFSPSTPAETFRQASLTPSETEVSESISEINKRLHKGLGLPDTQNTPHETLQTNEIPTTSTAPETEVSQTNTTPKPIPTTPQPPQPTPTGPTQNKPNGSVDTTGNTTKATEPLPNEETKIPDMFDAIIQESRRAEQEGLTEIWLENPFANVAFSELISDTDKTQDDTSAESTKKPRIQWIRTDRGDLDATMLHESVNPADFMTTQQYKECVAAAKGKEHKLGKFKHILVDPGYKILVKAVQVQCDEKKHGAWIKHGIQSALDVAKTDLNGALTEYSFTRDAYDWHLVLLTKEAYHAIHTARSLLDPRTGALLLFRPFTLRAQPTQTFTYEGITQNDDTEEEKKKAIEEFQTAANTILKKHGIYISAITSTPTERSPNQLSVGFTFHDPSKAFPLTPKNLPKTFDSWSGTRQTNAYWPQKCSTCLSETHRGSGNSCPWLSFERRGTKTNKWAPVNYFPGQTMPATKKDKKRKWDEMDLLTDLRPDADKTKRMRTEKAEDKRKPGTKNGTAEPNTRKGLAEGNMGMDIDAAVAN
jgi:hypothetical protein